MAENRIMIEGTYGNVALPITGSVATGSTVATTSLTAATTGTGTTVDFGFAGANITMAVIVVGTVTAGMMAIDLSQDGVNWVQDGTVNLVTNTNAMLNVSAEAWRYARARVATNITGGAVATCTFMAGG